MKYEIQSTPKTHRVIEIQEKHDHPFSNEPIYRAYERSQADGTLFNLYLADDDPAFLEKRIRESSVIPVEFVERF